MALMAWDEREHLGRGGKDAFGSRLCVRRNKIHHTVRK